jgi:hypothetical protein
MFILYAVVIGLVLGFLTGGRPAGLAALHFRFAPVIVGALMIQLVLFSDPVSERIGDLGPFIYVASTGAVLLAVLADRSITGMPIVAAGAACNLLAIVANGGYMPADPGALAPHGPLESNMYSNSAIVAHPNLWILTDIFSMPPGVPFANIFSIGDIVIGVGIAFVIVAAMRRTPEAVPSVRFRNSPERPGR